MFESLQAMPADAILGLIAEHRDDPRPNKIDLGVGVYRNADGKTPVLDAVKQAEQRVLETQPSKSYIGTAGNPDFNAAMQALTFADAAPDGRLVTLQTPGGSGSLSVAAGLVRRANKSATIWVTEPTWANHVPLLSGAGLALKSFPYYDTATHTIRFDAMMDALHAVPKGDILLMHASCHNPSGLDPSDEQWRAIAEIVVERELLPFFDMAYQGFARNIDDDAFGIRHMAGRVPEMIVSTSCSKNFGLYRDRVGALSIMAADEARLKVVDSQVNNYVRCVYSMPPDHGAEVVSTILNDEELRAGWAIELAEMRDRLQQMRALLGDALQAKAPDYDFSHLQRANGMFCFLGISEDQIRRLKQDFGIYMVNSSRVNVAGITAENVDYLSDAIAAVLDAGDSPEMPSAG
ncbi:MAG: aspartate/tyrosine/aromatic aminotransferase [Gammaproteobacteria bacterium]|nr:aspartate/tyrosine/aromatic aminotransferase [Gammaproteobacteria bacterium]MDH3430715.1 aspartate/tyrosine/aromatic aminotransferase [Gammaproteobacteria bacterium]MDH3435175.1 aspartate/tyrosine/aromatic aminotransferase [Gammaproteobacteria bacterium]